MGVDVLLVVARLLGLELGELLVLVHLLGGVVLRAALGLGREREASGVQRSRALEISAIALRETGEILVHTEAHVATPVHVHVHAVEVLRLFDGKSRRVHVHGHARHPLVATMALMRLAHE